MRHYSTTADGRRFALGFAGLLVVTTAAPAAENPLRQFLDTYCVRCHDGETRKGRLDLEKLSTNVTEPGAFEGWVKIHDRIQAGEMPPKQSQGQPKKAEIDAILKQLNSGR
jgi:hypothetical protein